MKQCKKCNRIQSKDSFYHHPLVRDGRMWKCIECVKKEARIRRKDPVRKARLKEYDHNRFQDPHRKRKVKQYSDKAKLTSPEKYSARYKVANAIRDGKIKKLPCQECGDTKSHAHHPNYGEPLQVVWLCQEHHFALHKEQKYGV